MNQALAGIRVVEIGDFISAPYCSKLLADLGADVVKVEPPSGDSSRRYGPFRDNVADPEASGLFAYLNTNKLSVVLDMSSGADRESVRSLVADADIVVESLESRAWQGSQLSYPWFQAANPSIILTSITPFGRKGPRAWYRGDGLQAAAGAGFLARTGNPDRYPLALPLNLTEFLAGVHAAAATLMALRWREWGGTGQWVDIAMQHVEAVALSGLVLPSVVYGTRGVPGRAGNRINTYYPYTMLPVADGFMEFHATQDRQWNAFIEAIGSPTWTIDERFRNRFTMVEYGDELDELIVGTVGHLTREELWRLCRANRVPFHPVHRIDEVVQSEHLSIVGHAMGPATPGPAPGRAHRRDPQGGRSSTGRCACAACRGGREDNARIHRVRSPPAG
jgi:crotonobetainyl-CoA:carnitine CoA-transferase CaiB-like acyl-CoA transferase